MTHASHECGRWCPLLLLVRRDPRRARSGPPPRSGVPFPLEAMAASMMSGDEGELVLVPATDIDTFVSAPVDRYVARRTFCFWQLGTDTKGLITWGTPTEADAREMVHAFEAGERIEEPHVSLIDMRDLGAVDVVAFEVIMRYMTTRQDVFAQTVQRQALVHGTGAVGAAVAGFYRVVQPRYAVESFSDVGDAARWLHPERADELLALVRALRARLIHTPEVVLMLRACFESAASLPSAARAARTLGMSLRTLQRSLADAGTSFRSELQRFRLERAERMLSGSAASVKAVAATVETMPPPARAISS